MATVLDIQSENVIIFVCALLGLLYAIVNALRIAAAFVLYFLTIRPLTTTEPIKTPTADLSMNKTMKILKYPYFLKLDTMFKK